MDLLDPQRAERLWLAMAVATLWMVMLGGEAEKQFPEPKRFVDSPSSLEFFPSHPR